MRLIFFKLHSFALVHFVLCCSLPNPSSNNFKILQCSFAMSTSKAASVKRFSVDVYFFHRINCFGAHRTLFACHFQIV
ncbi:hypothetical protein BpHYR1_006712 [Brachionus plicatilis]|uniref:Secreted protein n=1 Tax=Brachionus plicatilis TaxID=10195 RepID=A0A3M7RRD7_BRAPC|nr:hypothetical protein BpHYR1_006712 [Brachionus plicatilis]